MCLRFLQGQTPADDAVAFGDVKADDFVGHWSGRWWVLENHSMEWGSGVTPGGNQYPNQIRNSPASTRPKAAV